MLIGAINAIPIVSEAGQTVGMVTSHDLVDEWEGSTPLSACMTQSVVTIEASATVAEAAQVMRAELIHHLIVADSGQAVGVLSTFDLLDALAD
jgi:predicted transcriptional regulator